MSSVMDEHGEGWSRTEVKSHANMVVVDKHAAILSDTGNMVDVSPFTQDYQTTEKVLIVDT